MRGRQVSAQVKREVQARSRGLCEAQVSPVCAKAGQDYHHRKSRARGGSNEAKNIAFVCRPCHDAIELHFPGTSKWRTYSWQPEGQTEEDWDREVGCL